jgi:hypothetical protein
MHDKGLSRTNDAFIVEDNDLNAKNANSSEVIEGLNLEIKALGFPFWSH